MGDPNRDTVVTDLPCNSVPQILEVTRDVNIRVFVLLEDRIRLHLNDFVFAVNANAALKRAWVAPISLCLTFLVVVLTASFQDRFGCSRQFWESAFWLGLIVSVVWLIRAICNLVFARNDKSLTSVDHFLQRITQAGESKSLPMHVPMTVSAGRKQNSDAK